MAKQRIYNKPAKRAIAANRRSKRTIQAIWTAGAL